MIAPDLSALKQAAASAPDSIDRWVDLCAAAERLKDYAEVLRAGDRIVQLAPERPQPYFIRGLALQNLDRIEEAIESYKKANALDPDYVDAWINLGHCYQALNRLDEAEAACRRAIEASGQSVADDAAEFGSNYWNLAIVELLKGDLVRGFAHYPARFKAIKRRKRPDFPQPLWRGEDVRGKTLLITVDQGYGDTLMMARYLPLLRERGAHVVLQAQPPLVPLFEGWNGIDKVIAQGETPNAFDYHASEFDLPHIFGTQLDNVPAKVPYLPLPPPDDAARLANDGRLKVAVGWSGNPDHRNDKRRSIPLQNFAKLFENKHIQFFSLNREMKPGDAELLAGMPVTDLTPRINNFADTARFIGQMDLVITCDSSAAHLAGGMGKPVWVLLPFAPSWHWMLTREDSPWYPTMCLFRQKSRGDWGEAIARVKTELEAKK